MNQPDAGSRKDYLFELVNIVAPGQLKGFFESQINSAIAVSATVPDEGKTMKWCQRHFGKQDEELSKTRNGVEVSAETVLVSRGASANLGRSICHCLCEMQRNPMWFMLVSIICGCLAAGR